MASSSSGDYPATCWCSAWWVAWKERQEGSGGQRGWQESPSMLMPVLRGRVSVPPLPGENAETKPSGGTRSQPMARNWAMPNSNLEAMPAPGCLSGRLEIWRGGLGPGSRVSSRQTCACLHDGVRPTALPFPAMRHAVTEPVSCSTCNMGVITCFTFRC